jgi:hypothetical protein
VVAVGVADLGAGLGAIRGPQTMSMPLAFRSSAACCMSSTSIAISFLEAVPSLKTRAVLTTAYAAGLRASEAVGVKVADIDSGRMLIRVEDGKGGKDAQAPQGPRLARTAQALPFPLHPDLGLMARCRRGPLRQVGTIENYE